VERQLRLPQRSKQSLDALKRILRRLGGQRPADGPDHRLTGVLRLTRLATSPTTKVSEGGLELRTLLCYRVRLVLSSPPT